MNLNQRQQEIIYGTLLGDGCVSKITHGDRSYYRFEVDHTIEDKEYVDWLYTELSDIFNIGPRTRERYRSLGKGFKSTSLSLYSKIDDVFRDLREEIYIDGKKTVTQAWLDKLTPLSLAVWYMDDGSYNINRNTVDISTYSFSLNEHHLIQRYFRDKYDIETSLPLHGKGNNKHYYVYFPRDEARKFLSIVSPYVLPCMARKIPLGWEKAKKLPPGFHLRANKANGLDYNQRIIIDNLTSFYNNLDKPNKFPVVLYNYTADAYSFKTIHAIFGSWENALRSAGLPTQFM
jgi:hypothetical protein